MNLEKELIKIVDRYDLRIQNRKDEVVALRRAFSYYAHTMGVHKKVIGKWLDLDRTAIIHQLNQMENPDFKYYLYTHEIRKDLVDLRKVYESAGYTNVDVLTKSIKLISLTQHKGGILDDIQEIKCYINSAFNNGKVNDELSRLIGWVFTLDINLKRIDLIDEIEKMQAFINENINPNKL